MDKTTADLICRALLAIVAAFRKAYELPEYHNINIIITERDDVTPAPLYKENTT